MTFEIVSEDSSSSAMTLTCGGKHEIASTALKRNKTTGQAFVNQLRWLAYVCRDVLRISRSNL